MEARMDKTKKVFCLVAVLAITGLVFSSAVLVGNVTSAGLIANGSAAANALDAKNGEDSTTNLPSHHLFNRFFAIFLIICP